MSDTLKTFGAFVWETAKIVAISLLIILPIRYFIAQPFFVRGDSMFPNFQDGEYLIINEITYRFNEVERGDVLGLEVGPGVGVRVTGGVA